MGILFWVLMVLWLLCGIWIVWPLGAVPAAGGYLLQFILFGLLGWKVFGPVLQ